MIQASNFICSECLYYSKSSCTKSNFKVNPNNNICVDFDYDVKKSTSKVELLEQTVLE